MPVANTPRRLTVVGEIVAGLVAAVPLVPGLVLALGWAGLPEGTLLTVAVPLCVGIALTATRRCGASVSVVMVASSFIGFFVGSCLGAALYGDPGPHPDELRGEFDFSGLATLLVTFLGAVAGASLGGLVGAVVQLVRTRSPWTRVDLLPFGIGVGLAAFMATIGPRVYDAVRDGGDAWVVVHPELAVTVVRHRSLFRDEDVAIEAFDTYGRVRWQHLVPPGAIGGVGTDGDVVAAVVADQLYAFEPNGALRWTASLPSGAERSDVAVMDGTVRVLWASSVAFAVATGEPLPVTVPCRADAAFVCGDRGARRWVWLDAGLYGSSAAGDFVVPLPPPVLDDTLRPWPISLPRFVGVVTMAAEGPEIVVIDLDKGRVVRRLRSPLEVAATRIADGPSGFAFYDWKAAVCVDGDTGAVHALRVRGGAKIGRGTVWFEGGRDFVALSWPDLETISGRLSVSAAPDLLVDLPL